MDRTKKRRLERRGWKAGTVREFLALAPEESELIEMRLALSEDIRRRRELKKLTQDNMAKSIGSSQSRVAKI